MYPKSNPITYREEAYRIMRTFQTSQETFHLILFDFDETYFPHERTPEQLRMLHELEEYLQLLAWRHQVKIGFVTGSSLSHIEHKMSLAGLSYLPHFIGSNLGTELWQAEPDGQFRHSPAWEKIIRLSGFSRRGVEDLISELKSVYGILLHEQTQFGQARYKMNYYYYSESQAKTAYDLNIIRQLAFNLGVGLNVNACNPKAGDPEGAYDVDFIPKGTGKKAVADFLISSTKVPFDRTIAFGDSGNDLEMLKAVKHGYLLQNATREAKSLYSRVAPYPYAQGILHVLSELFSQETNNNS